MITTAIFGVIKDGKPNISEKYYRHIHMSGVDTVNAYPTPPSELVKFCNCLILCGGGDINPSFYNQEPYNERQSYHDSADGYEIALIKEFYSAGLPILGICRGMQCINVALGGTLIQDIPSMLGLCHMNCGSGECHHEIKISKSSDLFKAMGLRAVVNSFHHQSVHTLGKGLTVAAASHDGIIEAIEGVSAPVLGVQWHPERMPGNTVFDHFFNTYIKK